MTVVPCSILSQFLTRDKRGEVTILLLMWPTISLELQDTKIYIYTFFPIYFMFPIYRGGARYCFLPSILYQSTFHTVPVTVCPNILFLRSQTKFSPYLKDFPINLLNFGKLWHRFDHNPNYCYVYTFILT